MYFGMGRNIKEMGYICALLQDKCPYYNYVQFNNSAYVVHCFEWDCWFVMCRTSSEVHVKADNFKSKLEQFFVTCWFQFCAEVVLILITHCSVQIIYQHAVYPTGYILPSIFSGLQSGYFALISSANVNFSALRQQVCIKMKVCN